MSYHSALHATLFHVVYGQDPPSVRFYEPGEICNAAVDAAVQDRDQFLADIRDCLHQAQYDKHFYDGKHWPLSFEVGEWAWLCLHQWRS